MRREPPKTSEARQNRHLTANDRIGDLLRHPAFAGFAPLLLPWDDHAYDERMPLKDVGSFLPYHSHVRPEVVVGALNRMIDDANTGRRIAFSCRPDPNKPDGLTARAKECPAARPHDYQSK